MAESICRGLIIATAGSRLNNVPDQPLAAAFACDRVFIPQPLTWVAIKKTARRKLVFRLSMTGYFLFLFFWAALADL
jgi:hypothetical protein